jgi:hypothetical protein
MIERLHWGDQDLREQISGQSRWRAEIAGRADRSQRQIGPSTGSTNSPQRLKPHFRRTRVEALSSGKV